MFLNICENPSVLETMRIVKIALQGIRIAVPIILIVSLLIGYTRAVASKDDDALTRANKTAATKAIAAVLVFFIPTFVTLITDVIDPSNNLYVSCIKNATKEEIQTSYIKMANNYIDIAKNTLNESDYIFAKNYINKNIKDTTEKNNLISKLNKIKEYIDIKKQIIALKSKYDESTYNSVKDKISKISDSEVKAKLESEFKTISKPTRTGTPTGATERATSLSYVVHTPSSVNEGLPLILYLHGDGGARSDGSSPFLTAARNYFGNELPFILVTPAGGMWAETNGRLAELKSIIDTVCDKYKCNTRKISITGHSRGSIGTWHMINNYPNFFYSAIPVSCGSYSINYKNFINTKIRAYGGNSGSNESRYSSEMKSNVDNINKAGGNATFTLLNGVGHGGTPAKAYTKENILWMIN